MAEARVLVCDVCGAPEAKTVIIRVDGRNMAKDFCSKHLAELLQGARAPRRGRRPGSVSKPAGVRERTSASRKKTANKAKAKSTRKVRARKTPAARPSR